MGSGSVEESRHGQPVSQGEDFRVKKTLEQEGISAFPKLLRLSSI